MIDYKTVKENGWLILECITGSKSYGLDTLQSDTDLRGVFILPRELYYCVEYIPQVNNETNDIVYYELKRFVELLLKNNPNILELLSVPENCILYRDPIMEVLNEKMFLSKLCEKTFANYAYTQVKKAYGLEKKILNPVERERKSVLDFCFVYEGKDAIPFNQFIKNKKADEQTCGLAAVSHLRDCYNLYFSPTNDYKGIVQKEAANEVCLSSIPKGETPIALLYFNKDGYSVYCKKYKEYWEWVTNRNEERYKGTMSHGKNYDAKSMMHVFRLLNMAKEIAEYSKINVHRTDRDYLLSIKRGAFDYDELLAKAEEIQQALPSLYKNADLPDEPEKEHINKVLADMRHQYYKRLLNNNSKKTA